jgi:hypothetical protein
MHGIIQAGMVIVRGEERGHVQDHAGWDGNSEGIGERSCTGSCRLGLKQSGESRDVMDGIIQAGMEAVRGEERGHLGDQ